MIVYRVRKIHEKDRWYMHSLKLKEYLKKTYMYCMYVPLVIMFYNLLCNIFQLLKTVEW